jgi:GNAT superfamily N-acetyltransferase
MDAIQQVVHLSQIDEERFGIRTARASHVTLETLPPILDFCFRTDVTLLIARCDASDLRVAQAMEIKGFSLMDTLVYYARDLTGPAIPQDTGKITPRPIAIGEEEKVKAVAAQSFRDYSGHYHADTRLERSKCDEAYVSWAVRSCVSREVADEVLVAKQNSDILGFATLRLNSADEGEGVLFGVTPYSQGRGIYRSFMIHGMRWCLAKGASRMVVSTQITNIAVQKVWTRLGFEPSHAYYTFHKWFDKEARVSEETVRQHKRATVSKKALRAGAGKDPADR